MFGIGALWEAEESGLGRAEEKPLSLEDSKGMYRADFLEDGGF